MIFLKQFDAEGFLEFLSTLHDANNIPLKCTFCFRLSIATTKKEKGEHEGSKDGDKQIDCYCFKIISRKYITPYM